MQHSDLNFEDVKIGVIGDCMLDVYHYGTVDRISPEAPVPVFKSNNCEPEYRLGGACNTALNLKKLGVQTTLFGFIGKDTNSSYLLSYIYEYEIKHHIQSLKNFPTITKNRYFSKNQQIIRIDQEDTDGELYTHDEKMKLIEVFMKEVKNFDAIIISDYGKGSIYHPVLNAIMSYCSDIPIFVDPKLKDWSYYKGAFCITPNLEEFLEATYLRKDIMSKDLSDIDNSIAEAAANQCIKNNFHYILITLGSKGMVLTDENLNWIHQDTVAKEVYDVSGAGDTVIATIAAAHCKGYSMSTCMRLATLAAKVVISKLGTYAVNNYELNVEMLNAHFRKESD